MFLKNISKTETLATTIEGKKRIKVGEIFEVSENSGVSMLNNYKYLFEEVEKKEEEIKVEEKPKKKTLSPKKK